MIKIEKNKLFSTPSLLQPESYRVVKFKLSAVSQLHLHTMPWTSKIEEKTKELFKAYDTDNSGTYGGQLRPIEILSNDVPDAAPGYLDQYEPSCAYCTLQTSVGATYVHWGMNTCPAGHKLIYSGFMVGPYNDNSGQNGGGSNFLCLLWGLGTTILRLRYDR